MTEIARMTAPPPPANLFGEAWPRWRLPVTAFGALAAAIFVANLPAIVSMIQIWWSSPTYNHGFLILPGALYFVWRRRAEAQTLTPGAALSALPVFALFALVALLGRLAEVNLFQHLGFAGMLAAAVPLCFGWGVARRFWFPILFLFFMVPFGDFLIPYLQVATADASVWMLRASGVPTFREGLWIELPSGLWEVAEACAGVRFLIANVVIAAVFAYFSYDRLWKWALFGALALAVPVGANFLRAYGIMMLAHHTDNALATGVDHLVYGWFFFAAVMLALLWIGGLFADRRIDDPAPAPAPASVAAPRNGTLRVAAALAALMALMVPAYDAATAPGPGPAPAASLPEGVAPGWSPIAADAQAPDRWTPVFDGADARYAQRFAQGDRTVDLFIAYYAWQREGAEAVHYANRFDDDEIWKRGGGNDFYARIDPPLPQLDRQETLTYVAREGGAAGNAFGQRAAARWFWVDGAFHASEGAAKLAALRARVAGGRPDAAVIAVSAPFAQDIAPAEGAIADFANALAPNLDAILAHISGR